jgi:hypothetical protein
MARLNWENQIGTPRVHGTASIRDLATATPISYTPVRDYAGDDRFEVVLSRDLNTTALVQGVPLKSAPEPRR